MKITLEERVMQYITVLYRGSDKDLQSEREMSFNGIFFFFVLAFFRVSMKMSLLLSPAGLHLYAIRQQSVLCILHISKTLQIIKFWPLLKLK